MNENGFGDWRIAIVTTLAKDMPAAYPGGPSHKVGTPGYVSSLIKYNDLDCLLGFVAPHPTALALNIATRFSASANELKGKLTFQDSTTPLGSGKLIPDQNLPELFEFFENCMIVVAFSFQAIEAFANSVISQHGGKTLEVKRKNKNLEIECSLAERNLSTEEKITQALPFLTGVPNPSGKKIWGKFKTLKDIRDTTIHFKSKDISTKFKVDDDSLYYHFLNNNPLQYVSTAYEIIGYFLPKQGAPRWFVEFGQIFSKELDYSSQTE